MLVRNKKTQGEEQNWCLILNPLRSEIDKKKITAKIAQVFSLSAEETADLVANTPIILLDNLARATASKLKEYFLSTGADMLLTNDTLQKRKCYRTVWPEPPNLSFLFDWRSFEEKSAPAPVMAAEDPMEEMRAFLSGKPSVQENSGFPKETFPENERVPLLDEAERWKRECLASQEETRRLKEEIQKTLSQAIQAQERVSSVEFEKQSKEKEKEIKELQLLFSNAQEKNEMLKEEYRESRTLYEEKLGFLIRENDQSKKKIQELNEALQNFQQTLQKEKQAAAEFSARKDLEIKKQKEDYENSSRLFRESLSRSVSEIEQTKHQVRQTLEKVRILETAKETLEEKINEQTEQLAQAGEKFQALAGKGREVEARLSQEKILREKAESRKTELEQNEQRLAHELEMLAEEARRREARGMDLEKELAQIQSACESQEKALQEHRQVLETRDRELESLRRQLRDVHQHWEQRETVQRRTHLAGQLAEKENQLKKMVQDQEKIENEIRAREESMRKILAEQETLEKEIIEAKQAQRHLAEQAKRERALKLKPSGSKDPAELEPASQEAND